MLSGVGNLRLDVKYLIGLEYVHHEGQHLVDEVHVDLLLLTQVEILEQGVDDGLLPEHERGLQAAPPAVHRPRNA